MKVFWDPIQLGHAPKFFLQRGRLRQHHEVPARAEALLAACQDLRLETVAPPCIDSTMLQMVHETGLLKFLRDAPVEWDVLEGHGPELVPNVHPSPEMLAQGGRFGTALVGRLGWHTFDTASPITVETWPAALAAASGAVAAADEALVAQAAYALARPPGHHAYAGRIGGHCYLNNAALAAERLRARGIPRVAILDIDSHHGNGTQGIFWNRPDVLFVSVHADPDFYYPWYVGRSRETGGHGALSANINIPLPLGTDDGRWLQAIASGLDAIGRFGAGALVLSLGFDASKNEPLNAFGVTEEGFARAGQMIAALRLPTAIIQEGGYNLNEIGNLLQRFLIGFGS